MPQPSQMLSDYNIARQDEIVLAGYDLSWRAVSLVVHRRLVLLHINLIFAD